MTIMASARIGMTSPEFIQWLREFAIRNSAPSHVIDYIDEIDPFDRKEIEESLSAANEKVERLTGIINSIAENTEDEVILDLLEDR